MRRFAVIALVALAGCSHRGEEPPANGREPTAEDLRAEAPLAASRDTFAFGLKDELLKTVKHENVCFSPISMQTCLSTLLNGVGGSSVDPVRNTLAVGKLPLDQINAANKALAGNLSGANVSIANSVWLAGTVSPSEDFSRRLKDDYSADFFSVPQFDQQAFNRMNAWVSDKTKNRIPKLLDHLVPETNVVLVNAVTFDASWKHEFDPGRTRDEPFTTADGSTVTVPMMHVKARLATKSAGKDWSTLVLDMPYVGGQYSMLCVMPKEGIDVFRYAASLKPADFKEFGKGLAPGIEHEVAFPRFRFSSSYDMKPVLGAMGLSPLYHAVDLSGVSPSLARGLNLTEVVQKTWIQVDEKGTSAAAATEMAVAGGGSGLPPRFNRPFIFAVIHWRTGAILFLGIVQNPLG